MSLPKYTAQKMKGNIGEALVQYLLSHFCLVHKIDGSNDIGNDFICELIKQQYPTNLLFYVQVKFTKNPPVISKSTLEYWKTSPIPVYIFWIKGSPPSSFNVQPDFSNLAKKYKRMTPILTKPGRHAREKFKPFTEKEFKRDLIVDYARTQYMRGFVPIVEPRDFLNIDEKMILGFPRYQILIKDVIPEYQEEILNRSWVQPMVVGTLIGKNSRSKEELVFSIHLLDIARILLDFSKEENKQEYFSILERQKEDIQRKMDRYES